VLCLPSRKQFARWLRSWRAGLACRSAQYELGKARGDRALCEGLLDKTRNGKREPKGIVIHMLNDPLVQWAWVSHPDDVASLVERAAAAISD
jgi:hypothetical protein